MTTKPSAHIICDSISPTGERITSIQVTAHRYILAELNTHRVLSRSYRSSRAVPTKTLLHEVRTEPAMPVFWGANEKGMQANKELEARERACAEAGWRHAAMEAANWAGHLADLGAHKQITNRVLEPYLWVHGIITATEWDNFFGLRLHKDAQPEFRVLAEAMYERMQGNVPVELQPGEWHLPYLHTVWKDGEFLDDRYVGEFDGYRAMTSDDNWCDLDEDIARKVSAARCARNSYKLFDGAWPTIEDDLALCDKLMASGHWSPFEHQATPDEPKLSNGTNWTSGWENRHQHGNFWGWRQNRKLLPGEACAPMPAEYAA